MFLRKRQQDIFYGNCEYNENACINTSIRFNADKRVVGTI